MLTDICEHRVLHDKHREIRKKHNRGKVAFKAAKFATFKIQQSPVSSPTLHQMKPDDDDPHARHPGHDGQ